MKQKKPQYEQQKKDRYTLLPKKTLVVLRKYFKEYKPKGFNKIVNPLDKLEEIESKN